ncbi:MAG: hypothetical protein NWQ18_03535, partial [Saprospiraceae bacterium]|nr:hypothetical protein [Saprospiraceae bacterium]MDP5089394.1 hypothetical protein [Saprospiraceae bacterium]
LYIFSINNFEQLSYLSSGKPESYIAAIYTPFSILLFYEVFLLVIIIPNSTSAFVGKQFEIISLITLRSFFHDIADVDPFAQIEYNNPLFLKIGLDLGAALIMFGLTISYYFFYHSTSSTETSFEKERFIQVKKMVAFSMMILLLGMSLFSIVHWFNEVFKLLSAGVKTPHPDTFFYADFFNVMIFADVFLLIFSLLYKASFELLFRNACFIITTILLRYSLHTEKPVAYLIILTAFIFSIAAQILFQFAVKNKAASKG